MTLREIYAESAPYDGDPLADDMGGTVNRVHDWRNHIGRLAEIWPSLSVDTRMTAAIVAQRAASNEFWE